MSTSLVSLDRLAELHPDAPHLDLTSASGRARAESALASASDDVEGYLDRYLMVHRVTEHAANARAGSEVYARDWPVVGSVSVGVDVIDARKGHLLVNQSHVSLVYFAGYRRRGETLADLQEALPDLTTLPDELPSLVESVVIDLAIHDLQQKAQGAAERRLIQMGAGTIETDKIRAGYRDEQLERLQSYRRISV